VRRKPSSVKATADPAPPSTRPSPPRCDRFTAAARG
jgi:hypothetical protein